MPPAALEDALTGFAGQRTPPPPALPSACADAGVAARDERGERKGGEWQMSAHGKALRNIVKAKTTTHPLAMAS